MQNNFDDIDSNKGGGMPPSIPFEKAWAGLQPELDREAARRKRKRRFLFFWLSFIAIALISGLIVSNESSYKAFMHSSAKNNRGNISQPRVSAIALPLVIGKSLLRKNKQTDETNTIKTINPYEKILKPAPKREVVASATTSSYFKSKSPSIAKEANKSVNKQEDIVKNSNATIASTEEKVKDMVASKPAVANDTTIKQKVDSTQTIATATTKAKPNPKKKSLFHFGLQFNLPLQSGVNSLDVNDKEKPFSLLVPQIFITQRLGKKHNLLVGLNPYSQYYLNDKIIVSSNTYNVTIQQGSTVNMNPQQFTYRETVAINKLISMEATLMYQYQLSNKIKLGLGISNNWLQNALLEDRVSKNNISVTRDSLYGIDKTSSEWNLLKSNFLLSKLEVDYQYKKLEIGAVVSKPLESIANKDFSNKTPLNTNLFIRLFLK